MKLPAENSKWDWNSFLFIYFHLHHELKATFPIYSKSSIDISRRLDSQNTENNARFSEYETQYKASILWKRETQTETLAPLLNAFYLSGGSEWTYFPKCVYHAVTTLIRIFKEIQIYCCQNGAQIINLIVFLGYSFVSQFKASFFCFFAIHTSSNSPPIPCIITV